MFAHYCDVPLRNGQCYLHVKSTDAGYLVRSDRRFHVVLGTVYLSFPDLSLKVKNDTHNEQTDIM